MDSRIFTHAADIGRIIARSFHRRRIAPIFTLIDEHDARRFPQYVLCSLCRHFPLIFDIHSLAVANKYRYPHAGCGQFDFRVEYLLDLNHHLPLFLRIAVVEEAIDMRNDVKRDLLGEFFGISAVTDKDVAALFEQLIHALFARPRHRLVRRYDNAGNLGVIV